MKKMFALSLLVMPAFSFGAEKDCESPASRSDIGCAFIQSVLADLRLKNYSDATTARLKSDAGALDAFASAQRAWLAYRDAHCSALPSASVQGSGERARYNTCRSELAKARTHEVWATYLASADGTPPLLPEPDR